jgi:hypothetical protein
MWNVMHLLRNVGALGRKLHSCRMSLHLLVDTDRHLDVYHVHGSNQGVRVDLHMVVGSKSYKTTTSGITTQALGRIENLVRVGGIKCYMTCMIVDTIGYNMLMGLDFLLKIGANVMWREMA